MEGPFITRAEAKRVDETAIQQFGFPGIVLMENAGRGCVDVLQGLAWDDGGQAGPVLVACGGGNNAGDGFVIARHLTLRGWECRIVLSADPQKLAGDALTAYRMLRPCGVPELELAGLSPEEIPVALDRFAGDCPWLVDALLGTGATGDPRPPYDALIEWMNARPATRVAIDLPSGLDCDTGQPGAPTFRADHTCTFVAAKVGFQAENAAEFVGQIQVVEIGVPRGMPN
jgi:NAD(P)H-hydrate epimerase